MATLPANERRGPGHMLSGLLDLQVVSGIEEVHAEGDGDLAQLFDLILFGDFVSLYMAAQEGIDPGPVPALTELKQRLAEG